jgi:hypothetical protein
LGTAPLQQPTPLLPSTSLLQRPEVERLPSEPLSPPPTLFLNSAAALYTEPLNEADAKDVGRASKRRRVSFSETYEEVFRAKDDQHAVRRKIGLRDLASSSASSDSASNCETFTRALGQALLPRELDQVMHLMPKLHVAFRACMSSVSASSSSSPST